MPPERKTVPTMLKVSERAAIEKYLEEVARYVTDERVVLLGFLVYRPETDEVWLHNVPGIPIDEIFALTGLPRKSKD